MPSPDRHISAGRLATVVEVLAVCAKHKALPAATIVDILRLRGDMGGAMPSTDAVDLAVASQLVTFEDGAVSLTTSGAAVWDLARSGLLVEARRVLLSRLIKAVRRDLLALALVTTEEVEAFGDAEVVQCLRELGLLRRPLSLDAQDWWRGLRSTSADVDDDYLKKLGDQAEELSLRFEKRRLERLGRVDLADHVMWVSRFDEGAGYDILSRVGPGSDDADAETPLRVEVKACGRSGDGFRFFFSRNEWNVSRSREAPYVVHLWTLADMDSGRDVPTAVVSANQVDDWLPADNPPTGTWVDSRVCPPSAALESSRPSVASADDHDDSWR